MGRDKAFLEVGGVTLLARQAALLRSVGVDEIIVSGRVGVDYAEAGADARVVNDVVADAGPIAGLAAVLEAARNSWVLVLAVDLPHITAPALRQLIGASKGGTMGVVPRGKFGYEPLVALYPRALAGILDQRLKNGRFELQSVLAEAEELKLLESLPVSAFAEGTFANWNSPEDVMGEGPSVG